MEEVQQDSVSTPLLNCCSTNSHLCSMDSDA